jgi:CubicO group peptidase (beta-lactamase class C family)
MINSEPLTPLHRRMQWYVDEGLLSHVFTLIMRDTQVLDYRCFGTMDDDRSVPLREDAIYRMFSNTKLITSVAAMMLFEHGKFGLDDPICDYLPQFRDPQVLLANATSLDQVEPARSQVTVRQALSHSGGFSYGFVDPTSTIDQAYLAGGLNILGGFDGTLEDMCNLLADFPLAFQPGTSWRYSLATDLCARLVEVWSGQSFDDFLNQNIFEPLGMIDTGFSVSEEKLQRIPAMFAPEDMFNPMAGGLSLASPAGSASYAQKPAWLSGGGGLLSSVADYTCFLQMLANQGEWQGSRLLKPETLQLMRQNQLAPGVELQFPMWAMPGTHFGLGLALKGQPAEGEPQSAIDEYHWGGMAGTHSWLSPQTGISGFCGTQLMPGFWHPFSHDFKRMSYTLLG